MPGIGPITALGYRAMVDDPTRFKRSRSVGAYVGLTTRRYAPGAVDWTDRISKCGDRRLRSYPFAAAGVLLTRVQRWCGLMAWGLKLVKRIGLAFDVCEALLDDIAEAYRAGRHLSLQLPSNRPVGATAPGDRRAISRSRP